jgi:hypothetical protein
MSAPSQTPGAPAPGGYQGPAATPPAPTQAAATTAGQTGTAGGPMSNQNLNQIVGLTVFSLASNSPLVPAFCYCVHQ